MIMEPNKFDKIIKEKIEARTIAPSNDAWQKLEAMMVIADKPKRSYSWLYIAASFVGILIVSSVFFNQKESINIHRSNPVVLDQNAKNTNADKNEKNDEVVTTSHNGNSVAVANKYINRKEPVQQQEEVIVPNSNIYKEQQLATVSSKKNDSQSTAIHRYISAQNLLAAVSDNKVEVISTNKTFEKNRSGKTVDPNRLLSSVETELNQSFKESALDKFNKKLNAIKTAVVNRNFEE